MSFNFTVWAPVTRGDIRVFPAGSATPTVASLNWEANIQALANAAVVPLGTGGAITVQVDGPGTIDLIFDVNGYYSDTPANQQNSFSVFNNSSNYTMHLVNSSATCSGVCGLLQSVASGTAIEGINVGGTGTNFGVHGQIDAASAAGSAGVHGVGAATGTAASYGVLGETSAAGLDSAAVRGVMMGTSAGAGLDTGFPPVGIRGEAAWTGVLGQGNEEGVQGRALTTTGFSAGTGVLGFNNALNTYGVYGTAGSSGTTNWAIYANGNLGASGTKPFVEPHPYKAGSVIRYVALEGPEAGTYFRGRGRFVGGKAVIEVPESFRLVTDEEGLTVQITPIGRAAAAGVVSVVNMGLNEIEVESTRDVEFSYLVQGVRKTFRDWQVIVESGEFTPESPTARIPAYLSEKQKRNLIESGVYHEDGTVNMQTAERLGWAQKWREREQVRRQATSRTPH